MAVEGEFCPQLTYIDQESIKDLARQLLEGRSQESLKKLSQTLKLFSPAKLFKGFQKKTFKL